MEKLNLVLYCKQRKLLFKANISLGKGNVLSLGSNASKTQTTPFVRNLSNMNVCPGPIIHRIKRIYVHATKIYSGKYTQSGLFIICCECYSVPLIYYIVMSPRYFVVLSQMGNIGKISIEAENNIKNEQIEYPNILTD